MILLSKWATPNQLSSHAMNYASFRASCLVAILWVYGGRDARDGAIAAKAAVSSFLGTAHFDTSLFWIHWTLRSFFRSLAASIIHLVCRTLSFFVSFVRGSTIISRLNPSMRLFEFFGRQFTRIHWRNRSRRREWDEFGLQISFRRRRSSKAENFYTDSAENWWLDLWIFSFIFGREWKERLDYGFESFGFLASEIFKEIVSKKVQLLLISRNVEDRMHFTLTFRRCSAYTGER